MPETAVPITALAALALSACAPAPATEPPVLDRGGGRSTDHVPSADPETAVREEFALAERRGTAEAYRLFAVRHPDHALAAEARRRAEALDAGDR